MTPRQLVGGVDFGEGPRWHEGRLWYSDFFQGAVFAVDPNGQRERILSIDDQPSGLGWLPNGDLLVVAMTSQRVLRFDGRQTHLHADLSALARGLCNDMVVTPEGHAYVGNFGFRPDENEAPVPTPLIHVDPSGGARFSGRELHFPNGTVITPDGKTLIVGESVGQRYTAFDVAPDGSLASGRTWAELPGHAPDGCTLDAEGAIWFADAGLPGQAVVRVAEGGELLARIELPQRTFACMLGGDAGTTLFVLTAVSSKKEKVQGLGQGALWTVEVDVPHAGLP